MSKLLLILISQHHVTCVRIHTNASAFYTPNANHCFQIKGFSGFAAPSMNCKLSVVWED